MANAETIDDIAASIKAEWSRVVGQGSHDGSTMSIIFKLLIDLAARIAALEQSAAPKSTPQGEVEADGK